MKMCVPAPCSDSVLENYIQTGKISGYGRGCDHHVDNNSCDCTSVKTPLI